jgi:hypothetical protein
MSELINLPAVQMLLDEMRGMIADQKTAVETLRVRALALLTVGSLVATFFGSRLPKNLTHTQSVEVTIALVAFGLSVLVAMEIVRPRNFGFAFGQDSTLALIEQGETVEVFDLAFMRVEGLGGDRRRNEKMIRYLSWCLVAVCTLVAVQVVAWALVAAA